MEKGGGGRILKFRIEFVADGSITPLYIFQMTGPFFCTLSLSIQSVFAVVKGSSRFLLTSFSMQIYLLAAGTFMLFKLR